MVKDLEEARLFFTNSINSINGDDSFIPLLKTSDNTGFISVSQMPTQMMGQYTMMEGYNIMPDIKNSPQYTNPAMSNFSEPAQTLAGLFTGTFRSYFINDFSKTSESTFLSSTNDGTNSCGWR